MFHERWNRPMIAFAMALALVPFADATGSEPEYAPFEREHWAYVSPRVGVTPVPDEGDAAWIRGPVDAFVLRSLRANGLSPSPPAGRRTLIRRVTFDLTGLPPTPAEIEAFLADERPDAYDRLVDRLLASSHYGERWAQHWLDVVRYAETEGFEYDRTRPGAWRFRDYVVGALNDDLPYDRFVREQLAGDEIAPEDERLQVAAGFHRLGPVRRNAGNADVSFSRNEVLTERTNVIGAAFLGLTLGCARCHDHEYDAIRQRDYYQFQAFLAATYEHDRTIADEADRREWDERMAAVDAQADPIKARLKTATGELEERLTGQLARLNALRPAPLPTVSTVRNVADERTEVHVLERGDTDRVGERVGPRVPGVLLPEGARELPADLANPRTRLAEWIASPGNPLSGRVIVNRLWQYHFGRGLVDTPNDFGVNGGQPSHPELLDWLAAELVRREWRLKPLHRELVLSSTYRQSFDGADADRAREVDPENRLLWRFERRRLTAEELRDAMLAVSGALNRTAGGPSVVPPVDRDLVDLLYDPSHWSVTPEPREHDRRSLYLVARRNLRIPLLEVFDQPDLQTSCSARVQSTHAPQALAMLNGRLPNDLAQRFAERLRREAGPDVDRRVERAFELAVGRSPTNRERSLSVRFLAEQPLEEFALAMFNLVGFLYVE